MIINKKEIEHLTKKHRAECIDIAQKIWKNPENAFSEFYASKLIKSSLKKHGFSIKKNNMKTSIVASFMNDKFNISVGVLGEYDALSGTSMDPKKTHLGHGCGHNLLGAGSLLAAIVLNKLIKKYSLNLKVIYYGCPAEESGAGKIEMVKEGLFKNINACFTWHPAAKNSITNDVWIGSKIIQVNFIGKEAHASMSTLGINANNLMVKFINYLNNKTNNVSYIINYIKQNLSLVPEKSSMNIAIRSFKTDEINVIYNGIKLFLKTEYKINQYKIHEVEEYPVTYHDAKLQQIVFNAFKLFNGEPSFSLREISKSKKILSDINHNDQINNLNSMNIPLSWQGNIFNTKILNSKKIKYVYAPTDVGAISKLIPTIQFQSICMPLGISVHTKEATLFTNTSIGFKGMVLASKVLTTSILNFINIETVK